MRPAGPRRCAAVMLLAVLSGAATAAQAPPLAIVGVSVVDIPAGRSEGPRTVLVRDGRIAAVGAPDAVVVPADAVRVDGRGRWLVPGLVDMHVHLFNNASGRPHNDWAFALWVAHGVTGVREMSALPPQMATVARWREEVEAGTRVAPRVLAAGVRVQGDSPHDARREVRRAARAGADFVKVFSQMPAANWRAAMAEAGRRRLPVAGHVPAQVALLEAAAAGQRSNEHLVQVYEACTEREDAWLAGRSGLDGERLVARREEHHDAVLEAFDELHCRKAAVALARTGQAQVPTLTMARLDLAMIDAQPREDPRFALLREDEQARWLRIIAQLGRIDAARARAQWETSRRIVGILHRAGVPLLAGTDAPMPLVYPGWSLHEELAHLVGAGLSPTEALHAATLGPARFLGLEAEHGSIEPGKRADLLLLEADPLRDIGNARRIQAVILAGRLLDRAALDALVQAAHRD